MPRRLRDAVGGLLDDRDDASQGPRGGAGAVVWRAVGEEGGVDSRGAVLRVKGKEGKREEERREERKGGGRIQGEKTREAVR